jgi:dGTPase
VPTPSADCEPALAAREKILLAPYAMHSALSRGRHYPEPPHPYRGPYERDRDRILHCAAFRRLSQKTQVFTGKGDYHRSRLTHTLEVTSIARTLARALALNEDLVEALALEHDLGHPPFGHAGEDTLDECLRAQGGFDHNAQALRIVEELELRYPGFAGLNLSHEVLDGQRHRALKHANPPLESPLLEAQVVDAADSVAYDSHDPDDALEVGLLASGELMRVPMWREAVGRVRKRFTALEDHELRRATVHELIDWQAGDLLAATKAQLAAHNLRSIADVRRTGPVVLPGAELAQLKLELERFLHDRVYRHADLLALRQQAQHRLRALFDSYVARPDLLPQSFRDRASEIGVERSVGDYIAGMTDRFAEQEFERLSSGD